MEVPVESLHEAFGDADDDTVRLTIEMLRLDIRQGDDGDAAIARSTQVRDLELYLAMRRLGQLETSSPAEPQYSCVICQDDFKATECLEVQCGHHFCREDLRDLFYIAMTQESAYPPRCCRQIVSFEDARTSLPPALTKDFSNKLEELEDKHRKYCHLSTCSSYIGEGMRFDRAGFCRECHTGTCIRCNQELHEGDCPVDETVEQIKRLANSEGWQQCSCGRMVELKTGCNHITCLCKAEFCYVCGKQWKTCACPQFDEDRLLEAAEREAAEGEAGEEEDVNAIADHIRENHGCTEHDWQHRRGAAVEDGPRATVIEERPAQQTTTT